MSFVRRLACLAAVIGAMAMAVSAQAGQLAKQTGFSGGTFSCLEYTNGLGDFSAGKMQSNIARIWIQGYLAGFYTGKKTYEVTEDAAEGQALDNLVISKCKELPQVSILTVSLQAIASMPRKIPSKVAGVDLTPSTYTCGQHLDAKGGAASQANAADITEMWAFAFIQGYKNVALPDMEIKPEFKEVLINALNKVCGGARDKLYMDYTALVAEKVKIAE